MPKMKTHKATAKRYRITKKGKIEKRTNGQAHFNSRESGQTGRNKRSDVIASTTLNRTMQTLLPHA